MYEFMFFVRIIFLLVAAFRQNNHAVHAGQYRGNGNSSTKYPASSTRRYHRASTRKLRHRRR